MLREAGAVREQLFPTENTMAQTKYRVCVAIAMSGGNGRVSVWAIPYSPGGPGLQSSRRHDTALGQSLLDDG